MHHVLYPTLKSARGMKAADLIFMSAADIGVLRIELKFLLGLLRNRCARTFTPERLKLEHLVGWQVNKNNSPVNSTSIPRRRQK